MHYVLLKTDILTTCRLPLDHIRVNCNNSSAHHINNQELLDVYCTICDRFHYLFDFVNQYICIEDDFILDNLPNQSYMENCLKFDENYECT